MSSTFQHIHVVVPFSMNKRVANVGSRSDINYFLVWTTFFCSRRLAFRKTLTFSSFVSLNHEGHAQISVVHLPWEGVKNPKEISTPFHRHCVWFFFLNPFIHCELCIRSAIVLLRFLYNGVINFDALFNILLFKLIFCNFCKCNY
jgi:hypothetical protein